MSPSALALRTGDDAGMARVDPDWTTHDVPVYVTARRFEELFARPDTSASLNLYVRGRPTGPAFPTGQDTMARIPLHPLRSWFPLYDISLQPTGYGWMLAPVLYAYASEAEPSDLDETDEPTSVVVAANDVATVAATEVTPESAAAARVRELSGLELEKVANLLGVTRVAFYDWIRGVKPRGKRREHLLQAAHVIEEAARRLGGPREVCAWLLSPSPASNRVPLELIKAHEYELARSLLTRRQRAALPARARSKLGPAEVRAGLERMAMRPAPEDYEDSSED